MSQFYGEWALTLALDVIGYPALLLAALALVWLVLPVRPVRVPAPRPGRFKHVVSLAGVLVPGLWDLLVGRAGRGCPAPLAVPDVRGDLETMPRRGVIYAVAPSPLDVDTIWAGTDDGLVHVTRDGGKNWKSVTPPPLRAWDKVSQLDAGHFDVKTAYAAINAIRRDDMRPHVYRTHDGGATWARIVNGLHEMGPLRQGFGGQGPVNVVREDPKKPGLLFAGTERHVYFSIDDGDHWQPLRMNMPASSVRDLVIHDDDLVVGTHGRSIWILDDVAPLRELADAAAASRAFFFSPAVATRVRYNMFSDTPLPPEEPAGQNPPDGAILDYYLPRGATRVTLQVTDGRGSVIRKFASDDPPERVDPNTLPYPTYWIRRRSRPRRDTTASFGTFATSPHEEHRGRTR